MQLRNILALLSGLAIMGVTAAAAPGAIDYETAHLSRRLTAVRTTAAIVLDGALSEPAWQQAPPASHFTQNNPQEGAAATEDTEVRILYDDRYLYIGVVAHDDDAQAIITNDLKKDFDPASTDLFEVLIDTFHDERNGFLFAINPMGARWDAQMSNNGRDVNSNWDGIWDVRTRIVPGGWTAEIRIPFQTLRFSADRAQTWGVNFLRQVRRRNEADFWAPIPRNYDLNRASLEGTLTGLRGIRPGRDLRVKPYVLTSGDKAAPAAAAGNLQGGFDVKYGVTPGLTWDFTVNTDFSQVEADEQQVNLTRFSLFFPEKREFFLENAGVFQFGPPQQLPNGLAGRTNALADNVLFFSRRIGLSSDGSRTIPILAGTRLTGHVGEYGVGVLNIQQRSQNGLPAENFTAIRVRRNVLANSDVGLIVLNKAGGGLYNRLVGADANFRFFQNLNVYGYGVQSFSPQATVAGSGHDFLGQISYQFPSRHWDSKGSFTTIGSRFNDEIGFIPRVGINRLQEQTGYHFRPKLTYGWLREIFPHWQIVNITRPGGAFDSRYYDYHVPFTFQDSTFLEAGVNSNIERLTVPFLINSRRGIVIPAGLYKYDEYFATMTTNPGAPLSFSGRWGIGRFYDGYKHSYTVGGTARVSAQLNASVQLQRNVIALAEGAYTTNLLTTRVNYNFSTRTFLNALVQYNTDARELSANVRFDILYRPLSDFFLVYNDRRDSTTGALIDRALIAKMTYLMAF
ncbi:MAG: carbohydrate binding family 9 domain-containing protein [Acidobacteriota bacterium]|nr:carbohydrate binding family 9 domain-containing protein [Acidobacteriota bacterium]